MGLNVGGIVGDNDGRAVGVGLRVGRAVGLLVGLDVLFVGTEVGFDDVGLFVGFDDVGLFVGFDDVGFDEGFDDVGFDVGFDDVGFDVGVELGSELGFCVLVSVGVLLGSLDGRADTVGLSDG
jgi:hypothetical protein